MPLTNDLKLLSQPLIIAFNEIVQKSMFRKLNYTVSVCSICAINFFYSPVSKS